MKQNNINTDIEATFTIASVLALVPASSQEKTDQPFLDRINSHRMCLSLMAKSIKVSVLLSLQSL